MTRPSTVKEIVEEFERRVVRLNNISGGGCATCGSKENHDKATKTGMFTHQFEDPNADDMMDDTDWLRTTLTNHIEGVIGELEEEVEKGTGINAIPTTDEYANGWNDCRKKAFESRKAAIKTAQELLKKTLV